MLGDWKDEYGPDLRRFDVMLHETADLWVPIALCVIGALTALWFIFAPAGHL